MEIHYNEEKLKEYKPTNMKPRYNGENVNKQASKEKRIVQSGDRLA